MTTMTILVLLNQSSFPYLVLHFIYIMKKSVIYWLIYAKHQKTATGYTCSPQQLGENTQKTFVSPSLNRVRKKKQNKSKAVAKFFCVTRKHIEKIEKIPRMEYCRHLVLEYDYYGNVTLKWFLLYYDHKSI